MIFPNKSKQTIFVLIALFILLSQTGFCYAKDLTVEKILVEPELKSGGIATLQLQFNNPFDDPLPVKITDKNVLGNNGVDIQCLEYSIPSGESAIAYEPIELFKEGKETLSPATITYIDPETQKEKTIISNDLQVKISKGTENTGAQSITTIYQCDGNNMRSTSYSMNSGGMTTSINIGGGQPGMNSMQQQMQPQTQTQQDKKNQVTNNQMAQDAGALKQEMQQQREDYDNMMREFGQELGKKQSVAQANKELTDAGYQLNTASLEPESNNTGNFEMTYTRNDGETASLKGRMENGEVSKLEKHSTEEDRQMLKTLRNDPEFNRFEQQLLSEGYNMTDITADTKQNIDHKNNASNQHPVVNYKNKEGNTANITADVTGQNVTNVILKKETHKDKNLLTFTLVIAAAIILILGYILYKKYQKQPNIEKPEQTKRPEKRIDHKKEARKLLHQSKKLFETGHEKDAYEKASQAIRLFSAYELGERKEMSNTEIIKLVKKARWKDNGLVRECLNMCGMVEFAKYKANKKDFEKIFKSANKIIER